MSFSLLCVSNFAPVYCISIIETMKTSLYSTHYDQLRKWLKVARESKGLTLRDVSQLTGQHHSIIGKIEQSRRKIDIIEFVEYCKILDVDPIEGVLLVKSSLDKYAVSKK
jgi:ribosome-binding protein aMBF1 (putative translation factor)